MRLYKVRVRRWHPSQKGGMKDGVWCDERVLIEADNIDAAMTEGFEVVMGNKFFGVDPSHCQTMEAATVQLPYFL